MEVSPYPACTGASDLSARQYLLPHGEMQLRTRLAPGGNHASFERTFRFITCSLELSSSYLDGILFQHASFDDISERAYFLS